MSLLKAANMKTITTTMANREFSKLMARAEAGQETTITKRGKAIAKIIPVAVDVDAREERKREHVAWLRAQPAIAVKRGTRDELYDDE